MVFSSTKNEIFEFKILKVCNSSSMEPELQMAALIYMQLRTRTRASLYAHMVMQI
jgi:hypothetical protein